MEIPAGSAVFLAAYRAGVSNHDSRIALEVSVTNSPEAALAGQIETFLISIAPELTEALIGSLQQALARRHRLN